MKLTSAARGWVILGIMLTAFGICCLIDAVAMNIGARVTDKWALAWIVIMTGMVDVLTFLIAGAVTCDI